MLKEVVPLSGKIINVSHFCNTGRCLLFCHMTHFMKCHLWRLFPAICTYINLFSCDLMSSLFQEEGSALSQAMYWYFMICGV